MASTSSAIFHAYAYGTAFWYALRGACRVYDPLMVVGWFRPPSQANLAPNDLETYTIRNDGWCLLTLALILLSFTTPLSSSLSSSLTSANTTHPTAPAALPYTKALVAATLFHHLVTGLGAYQHYKLDSHYNTSMGVGVWGNVWLVVSGVVTLVYLQSVQKGARKRVEVGGKEL